MFYSLHTPLCGWRGRTCTSETSCFYFFLQKALLFHLVQYMGDGFRVIKRILVVSGRGSGTCKEHGDGHRGHSNSKWHSQDLNPGSLAEQELLTPVLHHLYSEPASRWTLPGTGTHSIVSWTVHLKSSSVTTSHFSYLQPLNLYRIARSKFHR